MSDHDRYTVGEVAEKLDISKDAARGLIKFLVEIGVARLRGERPSARGRGEYVYSLSDGIDTLVAARLRRAHLA